MTLALVLLGLVLEDNDLLILVLRNHFRFDAYAVCGFADDNLIAVNQHQGLQIYGFADFGFNLFDFDIAYIKIYLLFPVSLLRRTCVLNKAFFMRLVI